MEAEDFDRGWAWSPFDEPSTTSILVRYEFPRLGLIYCEDRTILFRCISEFEPDRPEGCTECTPITWELFLYMRVSALEAEYLETPIDPWERVSVVWDQVNSLSPRPMMMALTRNCILIMVTPAESMRDLKAKERLASAVVGSSEILDELMDDL